MKPLVSILIPAFNAGKWIAECIESALAVTWPSKEIIVVDDGSTDSTLHIAGSYASPVLKVVSQSNRGASAARNRALALSQGDYIQWLDADDLLAPDKITLQMDCAESGQSSRLLLSGAWGTFYDQPEWARFRRSSLWQDLSPVEWLYRKINENLWMTPESWLVSRKLTELSGPWNEDLSLDDDGEYFCRVVSSSLGIKFIPEAHCFKRSATFGLSHHLTLSERKLQSQYESLLLHIQILRSMEDSPRTRKACLKYMNRWIIHFYPERRDLVEKMQSLALELGGKLNSPKVRSKYRFIQELFGLRTAKKVQYFFPILRSLAEKHYERCCIHARRLSSRFHGNRKISR